ncbi:MAG: acyltransferase [Bacteroidaceae bacterium]|nr:acyltransferase [Bacteroidaceae bacterium]
MSQNQQPIISSASFVDTKPHYELLDGLRGAAALMVVWYHVFEGFAFAQGTGIDTFNHGHLGVDFFFMLSGFVISYAYDDRWQGNGALTLGSFFKRRLIRLHPMLIMGAIIGCITFFLQGGVTWDGSTTPVQWVMVALLLTMLFIPAYPGAGYDVRGNGEMFPLNGPSWSLFFEYIGNILYALFIRRLSTKALAILVAITGSLWGWFTITNVSGYDMLGVGWTLDSVNFCGGFLRMMFPFTLGMLLARNFKPKKIAGIFWIAIALMFGLFSVPYLAADLAPWAQGISINSTYEFLCVACIFPFIVWFAASGSLEHVASRKVCKFLGDISYPLYIVHYPVMYLFYSWLIDNKLYSLEDTWQVVILVFAINITLAYTCLKVYDEPMRRWLTKKFTKK